MIQIYSPGNRNYKRNGNAVLHPTVCDLEMNLRGDWQLTLENPADENINLITKEAVIKCDTPIGKDQRFRIYDYEKGEDGVSAKARPVFFDAARDAFILDKRPTNKTGQAALNILTQGTGYTAESDITEIHTAYYVRKNLIEAINGSDENSFINLWGGEPVYNNEHLIINRRYGSNKGARATFGNNLESITETVNMENVVTRIIPMAYNGYMLEGNTPWVDSPNIGKYELIYTKVIEFNDVKLQEDISGEDEEGFKDLPALREELKRRAKQEFENGIDLPTVSYEVQIVDLENVMGYEDIKDLLKIGFGDTVYAENKNLDITTKNRCVRMVYDCILHRNKEITLGETQTDYFDKMTSVQQKVNQSLTETGVKGEMIYGLIDLFKASMKATAENAVLQKEKAILFEDKATDSPTYGAMALGTTGFMIAAKRLPDDSDWDWTTFGTGQGFLADLIVAGTMLADRIRGGVLMSQNFEEGKAGYELDLNNGIIRAAQLIIKSLNNDTQSKCAFRFKDGKLELLRQNGDPLTTIQISDFIPEDTPPGGAVSGGWQGKFEIKTLMAGGEVVRFQMDSETGTAKLGGGSAVNLFVGDEAGKSRVYITDGAFSIGEALQVKYGEKEGITGRVEYSDGTYLDLVNGAIVGGNSKAGAF